MKTDKATKKEQILIYFKNNDDFFEWCDWCSPHKNPKHLDYGDWKKEQENDH